MLGPQFDLDGAIAAVDLILSTESLDEMYRAEASAIRDHLVWRSTAPALNIDQKKILDQCIAAVLADNGKQLLLCVLGIGGSGKSLLINYIVFSLRVVHGRKGFIWASTGTAAVAFKGATTIHTGCGLDIHLKQTLQPGTSRYIAIQEADFGVIDEVSMTGRDLLEGASEVCCSVRESEHPFGNLHMFAFGDLLQLEPIGAQDEDARLVQPEGASQLLFLSSPVFSRFKIKFLRISERARNDPLLAALLDHCMYGELDWIDNSLLHSRVCMKLVQEGDVRWNQTSPTDTPSAIATDASDPRNFWIGTDSEHLKVFFFFFFFFFFCFF